MKTQKYIDASTLTLNPFVRDVAADPGDRGLTIVDVKAVDEKKREVTGLLSTASVDRYGEKVLPAAFEKSLPRFMRNPKFLAGHRYATADGSPTSIGHWEQMQVTSEGLIGVAKFLPPGDALADRWWFRFLHKAQRTFSVGFITNKSELRETEIDGQKKIVRHFTEVELLEVSAVEIPANADALMRCAGAFALGGGVEEAKSTSSPDREAMKVMLRDVLSEILTDPVGPLDAYSRQLAENVLAARSIGQDCEHHTSGDSGGRQHSAPDQQRMSDLKRELRAILA